MNPIVLRPFNYEYGVSISESITINGTPYFTGRAIGEWLGYEHPRKAVNKIIERNPHIDNPEWATDVKLTSVEGDREVVRTIRVYNPAGLQLIVFESNQPRAIEYKIAVAKMVAEMIRPDYPIILRDRLLKKMLEMPPWVPKYKRRKLKKSVEGPHDETAGTAHHGDFNKTNNM